MKKLVIALVALLTLAGTAQAQTPKDLLAALLVKWNTPTEPFRMIGNVYYVGTDGLASYLITSPQGHILVDTVMPEATYRRLRRISRSLASRSPTSNISSIPTPISITPAAWPK